MVAVLTKDREDIKNCSIDSAPLVGNGLYSLPEAARIIHADPRSVRRWVIGYHKGSETNSKPILASKSISLDSFDFVNFPQLIELLFIRLFRVHNVSMPVIRAAIENASRQFHSQNPLSVEGLVTDGQSIFHLDPADFETDSDTGSLSQEQIVQDLARAQIVMGDFAKPYFLKIDYANSIAAHYWPIGKDRHVVIDPERAFGKPIDADTGIPTVSLYGMYRSGDSPETISRAYNINKSAVIAAIEFEQSLLKNAA